MLEGKTVVVGVSGSIAAYKAASLVSMLVKAKADVHVIMTKNAVNIINPITFETLSGNKCLVDTFDRNFEFNVAHISLAQKASLFIIAPATANVIAKVANGLADDMLTTTFLAAKCTKIISPAMNTAMYENQVTQDNIKKCASYGIKIVEPAEGYLACGANGKGKMPEPEDLFEQIEFYIAKEKDLSGKKIIVTAGPTQEALDPVRFISNHSSGKMGYAIAKRSALRGAEVTLIAGPVHLKDLPFVKTIHVTTAQEMFNAVRENFSQADIIIKAAAVADYRPAQFSEEKIKKTQGDNILNLERTQDILKWLGENKKANQFLCGFCMETENLIEQAKLKLEKKNLDMIAANNLKVKGAGFGVDTNVITLLTKKSCKEFPVLTKEEVADKILDEILNASD